MSLTTDITGGLFGPTEEEEKLRRQLAVQQAKYEQALAKEAAKQQAAAPIKKLGRPGYYTPGKGASEPSRDLRHFVTAAWRGQELGEPASYGGQAPLTRQETAQARRRGLVLGAEGEPIEVIRRLTSTYVGPRGGGEEYATIGQARQAFRRELGAGEYRPKGYTLATLKAPSGESALSPEKYFEALLISRFGRTDRKTGETILPQYAREFLLENLPRVRTPEDALKVLREGEGRLRQMQKDYDFMAELNDPARGALLRAELEKEYYRRVGGPERADQRVVNYLRARDATPENLAFFRSLMAPPPTAAPAKPATPAAPVQSYDITKEGFRPREPAGERPEVREGRRILERYETAAGSLAGIAPGRGPTGIGTGLRRLGAWAFGTPEEWRRTAEMMRLAEEEAKRRREEERKLAGVL